VNALKKALFLFLLLFLLALPVKSLVISQGTESWSFPLGNRWLKIEYNHSVEHSEVIEIIQVNSSGMFVREMLWSDFGAGLPEDIQGLRDGYYYKKIDQPLGMSLDYWFIPFNRPEIVVDNSTVIRPRTPGLVHFTVKTCPLILTIVGRC
jgi:hypothetical protein